MRKRAKGGDQAGSWIEDELAGCTFADMRLEKRFRTLVGRLSEGIGESIPMACQDWAGTKAAYRFFSNDRRATNQPFPPRPSIRHAVHRR